MRLRGRKTWIWVLVSQRLAMTSHQPRPSSHECSHNQASLGLPLWKVRQPPRGQSLEGGWSRKLTFFLSPASPHSSKISQLLTGLKNIFVCFTLPLIIFQWFPSTYGIKFKFLNFCLCCYFFWKSSTSLCLVLSYLNFNLIIHPFIHPSIHPSVHPASWNSTSVLPKLVCTLESPGESWKKFWYPISSSETVI